MDKKREKAFQASHRATGSAAKLVGVTLNKKIVAVMFLAGAVGALPAVAGPSGYQLAKTVQLGGDGGWDLMAFDAARHHLFITHSTHVVVVDTASGTIAGDIPDTPQAHGVALASDLGKGFVTAGGSNSVAVFDLATLKPTASIAVGTKPDAILYDPDSRRVFVFNAGSNNATVIDAAAGTIAGTIALGGKPEMAAGFDGHVFLNLEDKSELLDIDAKSLSIAHRYPLAPCTEPSGIAADSAHKLLFIGCHDKMMAVVDAASGKVIATPPIGQGVDSNRFDPETGFAFSSNGDGTLTVVHEDGAGKFSVIENVATQAGARTMEIDPGTHDVFLVTADRVPTASTAQDPHPRPSIVPGTFRLLVYSR